MEFEYAVISTALETIDVEDIANCYLCASDGVYEYYLKLYTDIGETVHETFGPMFKDSNECSPTSFSYFKEKFSVKDSRLIKIIDTFISPPRKAQITSVREITADEYYDKLRVVKDAI